ncbi:MAG: Uncharacterised protein [SAR116 cluster bacterium MED-G04]|nr:MAG: Uncharacterised protein [SAR116 cluster bacterium MED-G04]
MLAQIRDIVIPLPQRRQVEWHHIEPVIEVFTKIALGNQVRQVFMGGGDNPDIAAQQPVAANAGIGPVLQHPQQPGLGLSRHVTDFIEKQRPATGLGKTPVMNTISPGESAFFMAEEFAFDQLPRDRGHVDGNKGLLAAFTQIMQGAGDDFLAGAAFARDHHRQVGMHQPRHGPENILHRRGTADQRALIRGYISLGRASLNRGFQPFNR